MTVDRRVEMELRVTFMSTEKLNSDLKCWLANTASSLRWLRRSAHSSAYTRR